MDKGGYFGGVDFYGSWMSGEGGSAGMMGPGCMEPGFLREVIKPGLFGVWELGLSGKRSHVEAFWLKGIVPRGFEDLWIWGRFWLFSWE